MTTITLPSREVPLLAEADVIVAGAGVGGVCAATVAARQGARTLLVERHAFPGGVATAGLMCSVTNYFVTRDGAQVTRGLPEEFIDRLVAEGAAMPNYARAGQPQIPNDPEAVKRVMISMLCEAGVASLYSTYITQAVSADDRIDAVVCEAKGGPFALRAQQFVDATGDLDLFALAGGPHDPQPSCSTLLFRMGNVDIDALIDWMEIHPDSYNERADVPTSLADTIANWRQHGVFHLPHYAGNDIAVVREALERDDFSATFGKHYQDLWAMGMWASRASHGMVLINSNAAVGNDLDPLRKSECEEEGRLAAKVIADFLVKHLPGFEHAYMVDTAAEMGTRGTRRLRGRHMLTMEEYRTGARFPDVVGRTTEVDRKSEPPGRLRQAGEIPFRCLVADTPSNVVCGSGKSASTEPRGVLRGQLGCMVIGQAAGTAAALAAQAGVPVNAVEIPSLQAALVAQGVDLGEKWEGEAPAEPRS
jgi:hypothetical protein